MLLSKKKLLKNLKEEEKGHATTYSSRYVKDPIPKYQMPQKSMPAKAAYQLIHDELAHETHPSFNLSTYNTTWMEPEAEKLMHENHHKNFIDHRAYPQIEKIHERCVNMLANFFNSPEHMHTMGTTCIGSSEAVILALLAHKWNWRAKQRALGKFPASPNVVFSVETQITWEKFCKYFDVEPRTVPLDEATMRWNIEEVEKRIDENTICVGGIIGTTYLGHIEPISQLNTLMEKIKQERGYSVPIHVDAASGGFVLPFTDPNHVWDFRLEHVKSINVSGHKYGLVFPSIGWMLWKDADEFPEDLIFNVEYFGGIMPSYTLNFSRSCNGVITQYYNFLRLGYEGYASIIQNCMTNGQYLASLIVNDGHFTMLNPADKIPVVVFKLNDQMSAFNAFELGDKLKQKGWIVPVFYPPPNGPKKALLRVVIKENFSRDMADLLYSDITASIDELENKKTSHQEELSHSCRLLC